MSESKKVGGGGQIALSDEVKKCGGGISRTDIHVHMQIRELIYHYM